MPVGISAWLCYKLLTLIHDASGFDATMNPLSCFLQPAVRRAPRYSVRPFYATILIFTTLVVFGWVLNIAGGGQDGQVHQRTAAGVSLVKRDESEVPTTAPSCDEMEANRYSVRLWI